MWQILWCRPPPTAAKARAGEVGAVERQRARLEVAGAATAAGAPCASARMPSRREQRGDRVGGGHVQRLDAVRDRVHRARPGDRGGQRHGQLRVVDDDLRQHVRRAARRLALQPRSSPRPASSPSRRRSSARRGSAAAARARPPWRYRSSSRRRRSAAARRRSRAPAARACWATATGTCGRTALKVGDDPIAERLGDRLRDREVALRGDQQDPRARRGDRPPRASCAGALPGPNTTRPGSASYAKLPGPAVRSVCAAITGAPDATAAPLRAALTESPRGTHRRALPAGVSGTGARRSVGRAVPRCHRATRPLQRRRRRRR